MRKLGRLVGNIAAGIGVVAFGGLWLVLAAGFLLFCFAMVLLAAGAIV